MHKHTILQQMEWMEMQSMTMDIPAYEQLQAWADSLGMKTRAELIRAILRKKDQVDKFLYILLFSKRCPI